MDTAMEFEKTMRLLFGEDDAYQIAGSEGNAAARRRWLRKCVKKLLCVVNGLDTTAQHSSALHSELEAISELLQSAKEPSWALVYRLLRLSSRLLGFSYSTGVCHTPNYWRSPAQYYRMSSVHGGDPLESRRDKKDAASIKQDVIRSLEAKGFDDFKIALVLNVTEYRIKRLRSISRNGVRTGSDKNRNGISPHNRQ